MQFVHTSNVVKVAEAIMRQVHHMGGREDYYHVSMHILKGIFTNYCSMYGGNQQLATKAMTLHMIHVMNQALSLCSACWV